MSKINSHTLSLSLKTSSSTKISDRKFSDFFFSSMRTDKVADLTTTRLSNASSS